MRLSAGTLNATGVFPLSPQMPSQSGFQCLTQRLGEYTYLILPRQLI